MEILSRIRPVLHLIFGEGENNEDIIQLFI